MYSIFSALALIAFAAAQNASTVDIEAIEAHFTQAQIVPELISTFTPEGTLSVTFGQTAITPGQSLDQTAVATYPQLAVAPASNATDLNATDKYTVIMVDADIVGTDETTAAQTRHWLVNGASLSTVGGSPPYSVSYNGSTSVTDYAGPGPASGSGSHRYVVLVYLQGSDFTAPSNLSTAGTPLGTMFLDSYVSESKLQGPVAANYFQVEVGTATATVASTTAVATSTLPTGSSSATSSGASSGASGSTTSSGSTSASSAAATTSKAAAGRVEVGYGKGLIVGAVGVVGTLIGAAIGL